MESVCRSISSLALKDSFEATDTVKPFKNEVKQIIAIAVNVKTSSRVENLYFLHSIIIIISTLNSSWIITGDVGKI